MSNAILTNTSCAYIVPPYSYSWSMWITEYAQVLKKLGNGRFECQCFDGRTRLCVIRGNMRKKVWVDKNDYVLVSLRNFQDHKADIIHKYTVLEAQEVMHIDSKPEANDDFWTAASNSIMDNDIEWVCIGNACTRARSDEATKKCKASVDGSDHD